MKKFIVTLLYICLAVSVGVSSIATVRYFTPELKQQTLYDYSLEVVWRLTYPTEIVIYVINQSILEKVSPVEMVAIMMVENPDQKVNAQNKNYKKVWDKKKKKYVKVVDSTDNGLFQINSKHVEEFIWRYWTPYGETEEFQVNNYQHNTRMAVRLYKSLVEYYGNDVYAVCAYNGGSGNVNRKTVPKSTIEIYLPAYLAYKKKMIGE